MFLGDPPFQANIQKSYNIILKVPTAVADCLNNRPVSGGRVAEVDNDNFIYLIKTEKGALFKCVILTV